MWSEIAQMVYQHKIEENGVFNCRTIFIFCNGFNTITPIIRLAIWYVRTLQRFYI